MEFRSELVNVAGPSRSRDFAPILATLRAPGDLTPACSQHLLSLCPSLAHVASPLVLCLLARTL